MLEEFSKLSSPNTTVCRNAAKNILSHVAKNGNELEYAATRLIRGLESHKLPTRKGSYTTLSVLLGLSDLKPAQLRDLLGKVLVTNQDTTKKERRLVYIARILTLGAIVRTVPISSLVTEGTLLADIIKDLVELGQRRSTLLELATPFISCVLEAEAVTPEIFEATLWPCLLPLFTKSEVKSEEDEDPALEKDMGICALRIALECSARELKKDFDFLNDMDHVVRILLAERVANMDQIIGLVVKYVKRNELAESFWAALVPQIRSSHFETVCICVEKSVEEGIPHNIIVRQEIVSPLLGVFRSEDAAQQQSKAIATLKRLLEWNKCEMGKKDRKAVMKILFSGTPNLLHEYKSLLRIIKPFLASTCKPKDLVALTSILKKQLEVESGLSVRMGIVYLQVLARIGQTNKALDETKVEIGKRLLNIGFGVEKLKFSQGQKNDDAEEQGEDAKDTEDPDEDTELLVKKSSLESFQSVLTSNYNSVFIDEMFSFVLQEMDGFTEDADIKKTLKKVDKQRNKIEDPHLKYILAAYGIQILLEQDKVLGEAKATVEELLTISKKHSKNDAATASEIVKFIISTVTKEAQPPFDFENLFSRLVMEEKITDDSIQAFADAVDVEVDETVGDEDSDDDSSDDENDENNKMMMMEDESEDDEEDDEVPDVKSSKKEKVNKRSSDNKDEEESDASDSELSVNMDEATEEDLKSMDNALAKVFATKKKVKEEEHSEVRSLMRIFRLLEGFLIRKARNCQVSIPLMLLMPIIHCLQNSVRGKKNMELSTKVVTTLNKLNGIRKFEEIDSIETGTLLIMAKDISAALKNGRNKMISDLLGDSLSMLTKCYLQCDKKSKGETLGFQVLYLGLIDLENDKRNKSMGVVSNIVSTALTTLPNWASGKEEISKKLLSIIFDPQVRMFRKLQFLTLLRAALNDKTSCADDPSFSTWKTKGTETLAKNAAQYLSSSSFETRLLRSFTIELLVTLNDAKKDPKLTRAVSSFSNSLNKNSVVLGKLNEWATGKLKVLLKSLDIAPKVEVAKINVVHKRKVGKLDGGPMVKKIK